MKIFTNKIVFLDTAPIIYFIEEHPDYIDKLNTIFEANNSGDFQFITSVLTLTEVLTQPIRKNKSKLVSRYESILTATTNLDMLDIDIKTAIQAAKIRADYNFKTPDSLQLSIAKINHADIFFTNDITLKRFKGIKIITLDDL